MISNDFTFQVYREYKIPKKNYQNTYFLTAFIDPVMGLSARPES